MTAVEPHALARLPEEWAEAFAAAGDRPFHGRQVFRWLHARGELDPAKMTDLPRALRERLAAEAPITPPLRVAEVHRARDGTRKLVCELARGGRIECVVIPMSEDPDDDPDDEEGPWDGRVTLCVSSQVGCAMGCVFCASGRAGLERGLGAEEIIAQVAAAREHLAPGEHLRNLVLMGMGEPLHHYAETARALRVLTSAEGAAISPRRITVSTVGLVPGIRKLGEDFGGKIGLALSLHASNGAIRGRLLPMNDRFPFEEVLRALREYPLPKRRRITIEYTLIDGMNDEVAHARELARALTGIRVKVNLIPMNPVAGAGFGAPPAGRVDAFRRALQSLGVSVFVRKTRGDEVDAACGQLVLKEKLIQRGKTEPCSDVSS
ncbi:MAG: 23S rRNA (adenine(2503)-C(2))-methyltransferase RlmN [Deltaproteobacteria bacterium]|nr:23S rRNA (adenine(2503)-C(2))-methyltransferase RlmN [Deltaproteobacteria bacterium]